MRTSTFALPDRVLLRQPWIEPGEPRSGLGRAEFAVDARDRTVHVGGVVHSFARRTGLWSVLSALLTEPGQVVSPDQLARRAWGVGYHAVRHRVAAERVAQPLDAHHEPAVIASLDGDYRLAVESWAVLEPAPAPGEPTRTGCGDATTSAW
jgi:DNA-binding response OmpR family regulator